jgi:predicted RNase H-like HicB family nuclease
MKRYRIVVERTDTGYSAYPPDLPGCASTGRTLEEVRASMREAIEFHLEGLRLEEAAAEIERGEGVPAAEMMTRLRKKYGMPRGRR